MTDRNSTVEMKRKVLSDADLRIPKMLRAELKGTRGPAADTVVTLSDSVTVVGRGEAASIRVNDSALSRMHFEISYRNLEFRIRDLDSSNGTMLNGSEVDEYGLHNGDTIAAGDCHFEFVVSRVAKPKS